MSKLIPITYATGDGIGPEIMGAVKHIFDAAQVPLDWQEVTLGEKAFEAGIMNGVPDEAWEKIRENKVIFKAPLTTPQGGGYKSVNVTMRKGLGLFANLRQVRTYEPVLSCKHQKVDMVIVRENEEDLYAGIEYQQTSESVMAIKLLTYKGTQQILRYAFDYAKAHGRKKVSLMVKDNIMKIADGLYHQLFKEIAAEYPEIEHDVYIVDIGMARVADTPENFDVLVTLNLYGDIVSDIASQICGSVGLAGSANIGREAAMFEAVHGSAPDISGKGIANPSGLLNAGLLMLRHLGLGDYATNIENAWLYTLENGQLTGDLAKSGDALSTQQFAEAVVANFGKAPSKLKAAENREVPQVPVAQIADKAPVEKKQIGADIYLEASGVSSQTFGDQVAQAAEGIVPLNFISSRGLKIYPGKDIMPRADLWRARFMYDDQREVTAQDIRMLLAQLETAGITWVQIQTLQQFDGQNAFSAAQGA